MNEKYLGGFFELELARGPFDYHKNAYALNNGRSSFFTILQNLKPSLIYIPFYCCDSLLEPLKLLDIEYKFYQIDEYLELKFLPDLAKDELLVYINYFGIKTNAVLKLFKKYQQQLIIDNTQAFFEKAIDGSWAFNSARKFFGVPDGSYLYAPYKIKMALERNKQVITDHLVQRLIGNQKRAFEYFLENEEAQTCNPSYISLISERILSNVNYVQIAETRRKNFVLYESIFGKKNKLQLELPNNAIPFCYPLLTTMEIEGDLLSARNLFIPRFWKDVNERGVENFHFEKEISSHLLALPIDQRLTVDDVNRVILEIKTLVNDAFN